jgi:hypothetical protein
MPDVVKLAVEPLYRMLCCREPFDDCPAARDIVGPVYHRIRAVGYWAYQFHTYLDLVEVEHSLPTRRQVEELIFNALNQQDRAGDQLERFLKLTRDAIAIYSQYAARQRGDTDLSVETFVAITLLVKTPDSPYFSAGGDVATVRETPLEFDVVKDLSQCFKHGAARVRNYYQARLRHLPEQVH